MTQQIFPTYKIPLVQKSIRRFDDLKFCNICSFLPQKQIEMNWAKENCLAQTRNIY